ncbi:hypothetical protein GQ457_14G015970 [Hibiscus cannabinus]
MTQASTRFSQVTFFIGGLHCPSARLCVYGRSWRNFPRFRRFVPLDGAVGGCSSCGLPAPGCGFLSDGACPLCGAGLEDVLHVLRDCPDSSAALRQAGFADSLLSADWAATLFSSPSSRAYGGVVTPGCMSTLSILCILLSRTLSRSVMTIHRCLLPPSSGSVLGGLAKPVPVHGPASTVEVSALFAGLEFAIANGWPSALIESDAALLVNKLHRPTVELSLLGDLLAPSRVLLAASNGCLHVGFASRSANSAAHALASWACHNNNVISISSVCPELISRIVLDDLSSSF